MVMLHSKLWVYPHCPFLKNPEDISHLPPLNPIPEIYPLLNVSHKTHKTHIRLHSHPLGIYIYICVCVFFRILHLFEWHNYGITVVFSSLKSVSIKTTLFTKMHGEDIQPALIITTSWNDWIGGSGGIFFSRLKQKASKTHCQCEIYDMYI
jgi:hypothetical protein